VLGVHTILAPVDFSECSQSAFQMARALARDYRAHLIVLHVPMPPPFVTPGELEKALQRPDGYRGALEDNLRRLYTQDPPAVVEYRVQDGNPAAEILGVAEEARCDLIVMGTHGRGGLGRMLLGSVAGAVMRKAPCPVLTVKGPPASAPLPAAAARGGPACRREL
jgi:nucleotide-binding universal stress UspA family protein